MFSVSGRSPELAAFAAFAGPQDLLTRDAGRRSPITRSNISDFTACRGSTRRSRLTGEYFPEKRPFSGPAQPAL
jgi:hypothetical protein